MKGKCQNPEKEQERRQKIRESKLGKLHSEETKQRIRESVTGMFAGKNHPNYGKHLSDETKQKIAKSKLGKIRPPRDPEWCRKISEGHKGLKHSLETRLKMSESQLGEKAKLWKGGLSYGKYCKKAKPAYKRVRAFFSWVCVFCGQPQKHEKLIVHHVNYDKDTCCNENKPYFVTLCRSCHSMTNNNRSYWEPYFKEMVDTYYEGKCYLTIDEFKKLYDNKMPIPEPKL